MPVALLPDVEAAVISWLRAHADVAALSTNVGWEIKAPYPCLRLIRVGGPGDPRRVDQALIQVEAWGAADVASSTNRVALARLLRTADAALRLGARNVTVTTAQGDAVISTVRAVQLMQWAPDPDTRQHRYFSRHLVTAHAA